MVISTSTQGSVPSGASAPIVACLHLLLIMSLVAAAEDNCTVGDVDLASIPVSVIGARVLQPTPTDPNPVPFVVVANISLCSPLVTAPPNVTFCSGDGTEDVPSLSYIVVYNTTAVTGPALPCVLFAYDVLGDVAIDPNDATKSFTITFSSSRRGVGGDVLFASVTVSCGGTSPLLDLTGDAQLLVTNGTQQTLVLPLQTSVMCSQPPNTTTEAPTDAPPPSSAQPSDTAPPSPPPHAMMSRFSFWVLVLLVAAAYYVALLVSSLAVGESTNTLLLPLKLLKTLALSTYDCMCFAVGGKRPVGYAGLDFNDDEDEDDIPNRPSSGAQ
ncbi:membrane-associated protein, putative [Bodo saltans]|uniref:Membrane-associated protein, putative n=1 Tax=Bodo saltans TaxID=75058 RepID=A0A0S4JM75_BODSA|nr:membrane-associated protein, putative [Bodo saltans]|eukprot:CUG91739.1 membrane-associated protein, putative [Bodo saltans]